MDRITRRAALIGTGAFVFTAQAGLAAPKAKVLKLFVGTAATTGKGVYLLDLDTKTLEMTLGAPNAAIKGATYGAASHGLHYLVNATDGRLATYDSAWNLKSDLSSMGSGPCHVAVDATGSWVAVANYNSNTFALYRLDANGVPQEPATVVTDEGHGPNPERQPSPHAHWVGFSPDNKLFYTVDLGNDTVMCAPFDPATGLGTRFAAYHADPGEGPRQLAQHPKLPLVYLLSEIGSTLTSLKRAPDGTLTRIAHESTIPGGFKELNQAGTIALNRKCDRVYVSNRGHNSIAVFATGPDGHLKHLQTMTTGGNWPRFFTLLEDAKLLIAANQRSGELVLFRVEADGRLKPTGKQVMAIDTAFIGPA
jgi:6-phosphogluconolactonase